MLSVNEPLVILSVPLIQKNDSHLCAISCLHKIAFGSPWDPIFLELRLALQSIQATGGKIHMKNFHVMLHGCFQEECLRL